MKPFLFFFLLFSLFDIYAQSAKEIVQTADTKMRGNTSQAQLTIQTVRSTWSREMTIKTWIKGTDLAMILIQSPAKDRGIVYLKRKKEVWNWMPSLEKIIKLPPSMMSQSWMGTDFTNDDLVKESSLVNDYEHTIVGDTIIDNRPCYQVQMVPKAEAAVVWGRLLVCIDKKDFLELHTRFYDEDGNLVNTMNASEIKTMDGRLIPTHFEMIPADKPRQKTVMIYRSIQFNRPIDDNFFIMEKMKTLRE
ncbi:MAG TPA: outer membrane lipoprotein-sorting protein [Flavisolibacter sp.]|nr:outer membrane lipoprotein-sorting protein [Flavisolibacter sp.]